MSVLNCPGRVLEGYRDEREEKAALEHQGRVLAESRLEGIAYTFGALAGVSVNSAVETFSDMFMGYQMALSEYNDDGFTPLGAPKLLVQSAYAGNRTYEVGKSLFNLELRVRKGLGLNTDFANN